MDELAVLSPHLDDAVWSLGGLLMQVQRALPCRVVTVFSRSGFADGTMGEPQQVTIRRHREDRRALRRLGLPAGTYGGLPEAPLRGYALAEVLLENPEAFSGDEAWEGAVRTLLHEVLRDAGGVLVPVGFGGHVDHLLTRRAAETHPTPRVYYADLPYAARCAEPARHPATAGLTGRSVPVDEPVLHRHLAAAGDYASQWRAQFWDEIETRLRLNGYQLWTGGPDGEALLDRLTAALA
jgi:LmbE family N-acetylglucosaminyl deacetylase